MRVLAFLIAGLSGLALIGAGLVIMASGGLCAESDIGNGIAIILVGGFLVGAGVLVLRAVFKGVVTDGRQSASRDDAVPGSCWLVCAE